MADPENESHAAANVRLRAAVGYLELGMLEEAWAELDELSEAEIDTEPGVHVRLLLLIKEERWEKGLAMAARLCALQPSVATGFIHRAYCLHELGRTEEAQRALLDGPTSLRHEPIFFYNLACYKAVLGEEEDAEAFLRKSILMDGRLRAVALTDLDLKTLWPKLER